MSRSVSEIEADVVARRHALQGSLGELGERLTPRELASEIGGSLTDRLADASQRVSDKAATPGGVVAMAGMAFASAFAASGGMKRPLREADALSSPVRAVEVRDGWLPSRDNLLMLAQLSAAIAAGAVASRFIPVTKAEREIMSGVGPELRRAVKTRVEAGTQNLASPQSGRFGALNFAAILTAAILTRKR